MAFSLKYYHLTLVSSILPWQVSFHPLLHASSPPLSSSTLPSSWRPTLFSAVSPLPSSASQFASSPPSRPSFGSFPREQVPFNRS